MAHLDTNRHIYYYVLQGNSNILSDERDKKKLLDIILSVRCEREMELYAFCLTDEKVFLLAGVKRQAELERAVRVISVKCAEYHKNNLMYVNAGACRRKEAADSIKNKEIYRLKVVWRERLNHVQEIRNKCRGIHCIPVEKGYSGRIRDYWWSSYRAYLGYYEWKALDMLPILQLFAPEPEKARRQFRRFHELLFQNNLKIQPAEKQLLLEDSDSLAAEECHRSHRSI